jgi:hypothetical protein
MRLQHLLSAACCAALVSVLGGCAVVSVAGAVVTVASTAVGAGVAVGSAAVGAVGSVAGAVIGDDE